MWIRIFKGTLYVIFCALLVCVGTAMGWMKRSPILGGIVGGRIREILHIPQENPFGKDVVTLLVLGCDEDRYFGGAGSDMGPGQITRHQARSDMMMLVHMDFKRKIISGISIPRDTLVAANGHSSQKINAYHLYGKTADEKAKSSQTAVETLLPDVHIDRTLVLDFGSFEQMVDVVGGVDMYVPKNMDYDDVRGDLHIHLKAGRQHLNGEKSQEFVRFRHSDDDFHRASRQHDFVLALKDAVKSHWTRLPEVVDKARGLTGNALTDDELAYIANFAESIGSDNITMGLLPVVDADDGQYDLRLADDLKVQDVLRQYHFLDDNAEASTAATSSGDRS